ncbi:MAG: hypothetical protein KGI09_08550, partial [Thaumarchaeota archaeon]|nr:hypothetical protein [Nitrososphaerota archaeon]
PQEALAPLRQTASGVSADNVVCNDDYVRVIKKEGHERACVRPDSVADLVLRGWAENPLDELLLRYTDSARANKIFYDIMNEPKVRALSTTGWTYSTYDTAADSEHRKFSATIHLYIPPSVIPSRPECNYGMTALVVMNLKPLQIEHNYTEAGCVQSPNSFTDMGSNLR